MKKVLLTLCAVFIALPVFAVEVYNNGDNSVGIYGAVSGYVGYGLGMTGGSTTSGGSTVTDPTAYSHNMMYGLQGNSRVGTNIKLGNFTAQFEIGANERTLVTQTTSDTIGFRQAWAAYTFGNGSRLLVGKTDTPTVMAFISSIYDTDYGLFGFGGSPTGFRRFQVQYTIAGLTLSLIEDDAAALSTRDANTGVYTNQIAGFTDNAPYTPRAGLSYVFQNDSILAKVAATYTAINGYYLNTSNQQAWTNLHAFGVAVGVKPTFGNMYLAITARYGMNEDLYGEGTTAMPTGTFDQDHTTLAYRASLNSANNGSFNNIHRASAALEFGIKATENFTAIIGGGYQATIPELEVSSDSEIVHSYAVFLQGQYALSPNFALVPEIAWFSTNQDYSSGSVTDNFFANALLVGMQLRASF